MPILSKWGAPERRHLDRPAPVPHVCSRPRSKEGTMPRSMWRSLLTVGSIALLAWTVALPDARAAHISGIEPEVLIAGQEVGFMDLRVLDAGGGDEGLGGFF